VVAFVLDLATSHWLLLVRFIPQKRQLIRRVIHQLCDRHSRAMSGLQLIVQKNRAVTARVSLHQRRHLSGMQRIDPRIRVAGKEHDGGICKQTDRRFPPSHIRRSTSAR